MDGEPVLDLDYVEDSTAEVDFNVVRLGGGGLVEVQGTGEGGTFSRAQLQHCSTSPNPGSTGSASSSASPSARLAARLGNPPGQGSLRLLASGDSFCATSRRVRFPSAMACSEG